MTDIGETEGSKRCPGQQSEGPTMTTREGQQKNETIVKDHSDAE